MARLRTDFVERSGGEPTERDRITALWELCTLGGFVYRHAEQAEYPSEPALALQELKARHAENPPSAVDAYREAMAVLGPTGIREWEAFKQSRGNCAASWPSADHLEHVRQFFAVTEPRIRQDVEAWERRSRGFHGREAD